MKKILITLSLILTSLFGYPQSDNNEFTIELIDINTLNEAKPVISELRLIRDLTNITFNEETHTFTLTSNKPIKSIIINILNNKGYKTKQTKEFNNKSNDK